MSTTLRPPPADAPIERPATSESMEVRDGPRGRRRSFGRSLLILTVLALLGLGGWYVVSALRPVGTAADSLFFTVGRRSFPVIEEVKGELKAAKTTEIRSKVEGRTTIVWVVDEGVTVKKGDLLVRLASDQIEDRIRKEEATEASAIAALEAARKDLEILIDQNLSDIRKARLAVEVAETERLKYIEGDAKKQLMDAKLEIERAQQAYERAKLDYEAAKTLRAQKFITQSEFLGDEFKVSEAERDIEKAKLSLSILTEYAAPQELRKHDSDVEEAKKDLERVKKSASAKEAQKRADVAAKEANLMNTQNQLNKLREQLKNTEIRAPTPGLVIYNTGYRWDPRKVEVGAEVHEQQAIVTLPDPSVMVVSVRIHEAKTSKIKLGQKARIEIEGIPDTTFTGKITKIAPLADSSNRWLNPDLKEYETEITLDKTDVELKPGVTARTEIIVAQVEDALCAPPQAVYSKAGRHYVFRPKGHDLEPVEVTLGMASDDYVEVTAGLRQGDRVALAVSDDVKRRLPDEAPPDAMAAIAPMKPHDRPARAKGRRGKGGQRAHGPKKTRRHASGRRPS